MKHFLVFLVLAVAFYQGVQSYPSGVQNEISGESDFFWFENNKGATVKAYLSGGPKPASLAEAANSVEFWLYRNNGQQPGILVSPDCTNNCLKTFLKDAPLVILSHGFGSNHESFGETYMSAFLSRPEPINVIFVNWEKLASAPRYDTAAANCNPVGVHTANMINYLVASGFTTLKKIHFVGHSLGSHVANYVGRNVIGGKIGRITGLDPALPLFGKKDDSERLDPTDAEFVDVIHTAWGTLLDGGLAFFETRGHVDFYPNSGRNQPGCGLDLFGACSHSRANSFFAESIANPSAFLGCECKNWNEYKKGKCSCDDQEMMGWATPATARGTYFLKTNADAPFGQR